MELVEHTLRKMDVLFPVPRKAISSNCRWPSASDTHSQIIWRAAGALHITYRVRRCENMHVWPSRRADLASSRKRLHVRAGCTEVIAMFQSTTSSRQASLVIPRPAQPSLQSYIILTQTMPCAHGIQRIARALVITCSSPLLHRSAITFYPL